MSLNNNKLKKALNDVIDAEFSNIPCSESEIDYCFSNSFYGVMNKILKNKRNNIFINTLHSRFAILFIILILLLTSFGVQAYRIIKEKNKYQIAYENNIPISTVDKGGDFKYTEFYNEKKTEELSETTNEITGEIFDDPKTNIYNKMLNTIDHFNNIELTMETSMLGNKYARVKFHTDIDRGIAYEAVYDNNTIIEETFSNGYNMVNINHNDMTYCLNYLGTYNRDDTPYIPLSERITIEDDGIPCYHYRRNVTNCPLASYCIVPQELTFSYLKNFNNWVIEDDNVKYLNRRCVKISGNTSSYIAKKHNNDHFTMIVDFETGILFKFEGKSKNKNSNYIVVTECSFDSNTVIKEFDLNDCKNYLEINR